MADTANTFNQEGAPIGFCQHCGRPLHAASIRRVGTAVYCEPCLEERLSGAQTAAADSVPHTPVSSAGPAAPPRPPFEPPFVMGAHYPNPGLAALLGFIPGVGAMYNEQYAKGIVHLIVFALLVSLSHQSGIFGLFVAGWIFYMVIEAHHTARARRDGTPLPNPFGLNDVGERLGFGRAWPGGANVAGVAQSVADTVSGATWRASAPPVTPPPASPYTPASEPGWGAPADQYPSQAYGAPAYMQTPYQPVGSVPPSGSFGAGSMYGAQIPYAPPVPPIPPSDLYSVVPQSRFPAGAVWLIGLGLLFLLATTGIFSGLPGESLVGFILLALGGWVFTHSYFDRSASAPELAEAGAEGRVSQAVFALRASLMLMIFAILTLLDGFRALPWRESWPLIIIGVGLLTLLNRLGWQMRANLLSKLQSAPGADAPYTSGPWAGAAGERADFRDQQTPPTATPEAQPRVDDDRNAGGR